DFINISNELKEYLEKSWLLSSLAEHASIASFSKFTLDLMALGAPLHLIEAAQQAAIDEIRHARISFDMFEKISGHSVALDDFPNHALEVSPNINSVSEALFWEACFNETISAICVSEAAKRCQIPFLTEQ